MTVGIVARRQQRLEFGEGGLRGRAVLLKHCLQLVTGLLNPGAVLAYDRLPQHGGRRLSQRAGANLLGEFSDPAIAQTDIDRDRGSAMRRTSHGRSLGLIQPPLMGNLRCQRQYSARIKLHEIAVGHRSFPARCIPHK